MNKLVSQAIKKAVSEYSNSNQELINKDKRPDLFSLNNNTELFQNSRGITIKIDRSRDSNLTEFGKATLSDRYLGLNESYQDLFARVASHYADDNYTLKDFIIISVTYGSCQQHQFYLTEEQQEAFLFHVFSTKQEIA